MTCRLWTWHSVTEPEMVPVAVIRELGVPDQPGRSAMDTLLRFVGDRKVVVTLDNCEHLLDACSALITTALGACPNLTVLATSREPIGVPGEVTWRVPSLSLTGDAIELFVDRARLARPDFTINGDNVAAVREICSLLDGLPLGIELAAARVRMMSLTEILDALRQRSSLPTDAARNCRAPQRNAGGFHRLVTCLTERARTRPVSAAGRLPRWL